MESFEIIVLFTLLCCGRNVYCGCGRTTKTEMDPSILLLEQNFHLGLFVVVLLHQLILHVNHNMMVLLSYSYWILCCALIVICIELSEILPCFLFLANLGFLLNVRFNILLYF